MNVREVIRKLRADGWVHTTTAGSHMQFKHPAKPGKVTVPAHGMNHDLKIGTLNSILRQAGLK